MDRTEVIRLLAEISLVDDRVVKTDETEQEAQVRMWSVVLRDVSYEFAGEAVGQHYAEHAWAVMPKDIASRWRAEARVSASEPNSAKRSVRAPLPIGWDTSAPSRRTRPPRSMPS